VSRAAAPLAGPGSEPLIQAVGLSAGYGPGLAIRDLNLEVHPGEVVALLGANGAGKTTTLLSLAGELRPAAGKVIWDGDERWSPLHRKARQGLGYVPEDKFVFKGLTTAQNLAIGRRTDHGAVLKMFPQLSNMLARRAGLLSGGEARMLSVGQAISGRTRLLLADELSLGLAPRTVGIILDEIRKAADYGLGALVVEQHVHRILAIADRVYLMQRGRIRLATTAADALARLDEIRAHYLAADATLDDED
jgi:ABC-type branched-subunit amino acid transport system ATPase component